MKRVRDALGVSEWQRNLYGDPCHECGYGWSISQPDAVALVEGIPRRYSDLLAGRDGSARHRDLRWSATEYVCHVTDNLRIWAERLAGAARGATATLVPYDSDLLAQARAYNGVHITGALWSLEHAVRDWQEAVRLASTAGVSLIHPDRGEQTVLDVVRGNAHDAHHHGWDISRSLNQQ